MSISAHFHSRQDKTFDEATQMVHSGCNPSRLVHPVTHAGAQRDYSDTSNASPMPTWTLQSGSNSSVFDHYIPIRSDRCINQTPPSPVRHGGFGTFYNTHFGGTNQVSHIDASTSAAIQVDQQTEHNVSWKPVGMCQQSSFMISSPAIGQGRFNDTASVVNHAFLQSPYGTFENGNRTVDHRRIQWPGPPEGRFLSPLVAPVVPDLGHALHEPNGNWSPSCSSHTMYSPIQSMVPSDRKVAIPHLPYLPFSPSLLHRPPSHLMPTESREQDFLARFVPSQCSDASSHRRRGARAIEYNGVWLDEQELLAGMTGSDGRLNVFQCHWEENRTPCHIWIKGDKSSINLHIQRWHGGRPGGDKMGVECHWAGCGAAMLKESIPRHIVSVHLGEMWKCQGCGKEATRYDVHRRHTLSSDLEACRTSGALITYSADAQAVDARAALGGGGRLRHLGE